MRLWLEICDRPELGQQLRRHGCGVTSNNSLAQPAFLFARTTAQKSDTAFCGAGAVTGPRSDRHLRLGPNIAFYSRADLSIRLDTDIADWLLQSLCTAKGRPRRHAIHSVNQRKNFTEIIETSSLAQAGDYNCEEGPTAAKFNNGKPVFCL